MPPHIFIRVLFLALFLSACAVKPLSLQQTNHKIDALTHLLEQLSSKVQHFEAQDVAQRSITYSQKLAQKYEAINAPWLQNSLVNLGIKKRGLCHEWAEDLLRYLVQKEYRSFSFHAVGANIGHLNEHNALSVSLKGEGIARSILLDAWRNSGNLYFVKIDKDEKYKWRERKNLYGLLPQKRGNKK
jgi:hypothetical protein